MKEKCPMCGKELTGVGFLHKYCEYCKDPEKYKLPQGISEYKRTCNECEKVWHSLVSREEEIEGQFKNYEKASWCFCCGGNSESLTQSVRNRDAAKENLDKLKKCPNCLSSNYKEEVVSHEKK